MSDQGLVVVDGDLIGFKAAAACETRTIDVYDGEEFLGNFPNRTKFKAVLKETYPDKTIEDFQVEDKQEVENIANCLHTVKVMLQNIKTACKVKDLKVIVQGEGNFRDELLLPSKYKGGRVDKIKPLLLKDCKDYIVRQFDTEFANGEESDDVCASYAYKGYIEKKRIIQASVDKDANSNVGLLYNWDKMTEPKLIQGLGFLTRDSKGRVLGEGRKWFVHQCIFGDRADSYCPYELSGVRFGEKSSYDLLKDLTTDQECWQVMYDLYKSWYPTDFEYKAWDGSVVQSSAVQMMQMYADCVHMRRWSDPKPDRLNVVEIMRKLGVKFGED